MRQTRRLMGLLHGAAPYSWFFVVTSSALAEGWLYTMNWSLDMAGRLTISIFCVSISTAYLLAHIPPSQAVDDLSLMMFCIWLA